MAALDVSRVVILPYGEDSVDYSEGVDRSDTITGCYNVLCETLDDSSEVLEVISKNPGVLGCPPAELAKAKAEDIRRTTAVASGISGAFAPVRNFFGAQSWWDEDSKPAQEPDSSGSVWDRLGFGGDGAADDDDDDEPLELPELVIDGVSYLYDLEGKLFGIEQAILTEEGEPVAIWNPELADAERAEFVDGDDDEGD